MLHINTSCHMFVGHVTHECVTSHMNEECHVWKKRINDMRTMDPSEYQLKWRVNESCHMYEWVALHINELQLMNECVTSDMNEACHIWMSHVIHEWIASHIEWKKPPSPGGFPIYYVPWWRTWRRRTPPKEPPPKLINVGGGASGGVLFLWVLDVQTPQQRNPPRGRFFRSTWMSHIKNKFGKSTSRVLSIHSSANWRHIHSL